MSENDFDEKWLDLLVCPETGQELVYDRNKQVLQTKDKKKSYTLINGIPRLIDD